MSYELSDYLPAIHDPGGAHLLTGRGTIVFTEEIGANPDDRSGKSYQAYRAQGLAVVVRLNYGYEPKGTIPREELYGNFARRVAHFIQASKGCVNWIIGNEPNYFVERPELPDGSREVITPAMYANCFNRCARLVYSEVGDHHNLWLAAVAPWNIQTKYQGNEGGDWIKYYTDLWELTKGLARGAALHTYTHGADPALVTSPEKMRDHPYTDRFYHFRAFEDFLRATPEWARRYPLAITETDQDQEWADTNSGWVQAAYKLVSDWNNGPGLLLQAYIEFVALYRWPKSFDKFGFEHKPQVQADLSAAVAVGYRAPKRYEVIKVPKVPQEGSAVYLPAVGTGGAATPAPPPYPKDWDPRLTDRGVTVERAAAKPGDLVWRVTRGRWASKAEAGGRRAIYVNVYGEGGERVTGAKLVAAWPGEQAPFYTENKPPGEPMGNFPMGPSRNEYSVWVDHGGHPSDTVAGVGMGQMTPQGFNPGEHTYSEFDWRLERYQPAALPAPPPPAPGPQPPTKPAPTPPPAPPMGPKDLRIAPLIAEAVVEVESGANGFGPDGRLKARIEAHVLRRYMSPEMWGNFFSYEEANPLRAYYRLNAASPWVEYHSQGQPGEWAALELAARVAGPAAAFKATSWGAPQIMGFHHERIGYATVEDMIKAFNRSEAVQLIAFFNFLLSDLALLDAMRVGDFGAVARLYNGNEAVYKPLLERAYKRLLEG